MRILHDPLQCLTTWLSCSIPLSKQIYSLGIYLCNFYKRVFYKNGSIEMLHNVVFCLCCAWVIRFTLKWHVIHIHANFPDLVGIFPILHAIPDFPIGIPNNTRNPDFVKIHPDLRQWPPISYSNSKSFASSFRLNQSEMGIVEPPLLFTYVACRDVYTKSTPPGV